MTLYLAYGSNMSRRQMAGRCPGARVLGPVIVSGWRLIINQAGYATIVADPAGRIGAVLWRLAPSNDAALDDYEEVGAGLYQRRFLDVDGFGRALVYVAADSTPGVPRPRYFAGLLAAARREGLPADYLAELKSWSGQPTM
jgi:hypothetical protein